MPAQNDIDYFPPSGFYFSVTIDGGDGLNAAFQEVNGLEVEQEVEEIKEGGENNYSHRVPGRLKYNNLVLKRGLITNGSSLLTWVKNALRSEGRFNGGIQLKNITVELLDPMTEGNALMTWNIKRAYPVKWSASGLNSQDDSIVIESIELAFREFSIQ